MHFFNDWTFSGGIFDLSFWGLVGVALLLTHITIATVTVFLHRGETHGAVTFHPLVEIAFRTWLWLTTGMLVKEWVPIHRKHHAKVDTPDDPHSPIWKGVWRILFLGVVDYIREAKNPETIREYWEKRGGKESKLDEYLFIPFKWWGVGFLLGVLNFGAFGWPGLIIWGVQALWIPFWAAGVINGFGHFFGYRNYEPYSPATEKALGESVNIVPWGVLIGGEELHNNHHAQATSPFLAHKWWEFDIGGVYIRILCLLRLAKLRVPLVPQNIFQRMYYGFFNLSA